MGRVFLSHNSKDKEFVRELYRRLTRDGVDCFFDEESIGWGDNWVRALEEALDECSDVVFVLSPDFCSSEWVRVERTSRMADDPAGLKSKSRPLLLKQCEVPRFLKQVQTLDVSTDELFERNYAKICTALGGTVVAETGSIDRSKLPPVRKLPARHRMPYRSLGDQFVGRSEALWEIHDALHKGGTAIVQGVGVLAGTGGLGKTQTAIEYVHRFGVSYQGGVYWVDAERGLGGLIAQVAEAAKVEVDGKADEKEQFGQLWRELSQRAASLMVLDNFPEEGELEPYLPTTGAIHTLVTTRRRDLDRFPNVQLNVLRGEAGMALLNSGPRKVTREEADGLVARLGGLPLALELTKGFLNFRREASVAQVLTDVEKSGDVSVLQGFAKRYRNELPSGHEKDVAQTFQMSWSLVGTTTQDVLRVMAEMAPVGVPRAVIRDVLDLPEAAGLDDGLGESLGELVRLSLVELDGNENPFMHRLVHGFVRYRNQADGASFFEKAAQAVVKRMWTTFKNPGAEEMREMDLLLPHAEVMSGDDRLAVDRAVDLLSQVGSHYQDLGRFTLSLQFSGAALEKAEKGFAPGHPSIATGQSNLALVLKDLGRLDQASDLLTKALAADEKSFAPGHPSIATRQSNLAQVLQDLGRLDEAGDLLEKALAAAEKSFAPDHPSIATRQSNLALVLQDLGRLDEASDLLTKALAANEKSFAPGHPSIATRQSNLALVLQDLGRLDEASDLLTKALAAYEKSFAPGHPNIATSQSNLALVLKHLGRLDEARDLLTKALAANEKSFAPGHPSIAIRQLNLGALLRDLGRLEEARELLQRALAAFEEKFGPEHRYVVNTRSHLERVLRELGEKTRAAKGGE